MIKKILYFILLAAELFVGTLLLMSLWESNMTITCVVAIVATLGLLLWQTVRFFKATDPTVKRKSTRNIALALLIPFAAFVAVYTYLVVGLAIAFS